MFRRSLSRRRRRHHEAGRRHGAECDPEDGGAPRAHVDRTERLLAVGVIVMPVVVAVVVGRVVGDRIRVSGGVPACGSVLIVGLEPPMAFSQTVRSSHRDA